jgi:hypothetical protein
MRFSGGAGSEMITGVGAEVSLELPEIPVAATSTSIVSPTSLPVGV